MDSPVSRTCRRCQRPEGAGTRFRQTTVPDAKLGKRTVLRGVCTDCENEISREYRALRRAPPPPPPPELEVGLLIPDCHHPNVSEPAWRLLLRAAMLLKPTTIVLLGDFLDGESLSLHEPDEPGKRDFEDELSAVLQALTQLDQLGATRKVYVCGNHEDRLARFLARKAPALYRSLRLPELLHLEERGWQWVPYKQSLRVGKLNMTHDTGSAGMNAHRASARAFMGNAAIGHTHRMAYEVVGRFNEEPYLAAMFGWLGDAKAAARYIHEAKSAEWVHGFGVFYLEPSGVCHVQPVPIVGGRCVVQGKLVS